MDIDTQNYLFDFVKKSLLENNCKYLSIMWYGGEPLLHKNVIYDLSEKFTSFCIKNSIAYSAAIVTNGFLLDSETAKKII